MSAEVLKRENCHSNAAAYLHTFVNKAKLVVAWIPSIFVRIRVFHQTHSLSVHSSSILLLFFIFLIFEVLAAC
jgi:hypothetical protein